jgi:hypothetical protein
VLDITINNNLRGLICLLRLIINDLAYFCGRKCLENKDKPLD